MLHELLLALLGYTGDFIIDEREQSKTLGISNSQCIDSNEHCFKIAADISFIEPSERNAIERLIPLGFYYKELNRFASTSRNLTSIQTTRNSYIEKASKFDVNPRKASIYHRAIANGIVEILSVYRAAVLQVEQNLLSNPTPIISTVTKGLNKFTLLLSPLYELITEIEREDIRGGKLLNLLHKRCHCGVPELQACIQRLLWHGHQVLYNQLASWMVYGILQDQHGEFFIRRQYDGDLESESHHDSVKKLMQKTAEDPCLSDWHLGFHIYLEMLPEYIHMHIAESILFAGKAIRVLRNPSSSFKLQDSLIQQPNFRGSQRNPGIPGPGGFYSQKEFKGMSLIAEDLLPQSEADKIESMLKDLKTASEFHKRLFESSVNAIRTVAANHLWQLVVIRADLNGHLKALKDYFLLAKGDFFQCFLEESRQLMRLPPRQSTAEADLMVPFQLAALKTIGDEDKYFSRVSLRMSSFGINATTTSQAEEPKNKNSLDSVLGSISHRLASSDMSLDGWDGITLEYFIDWPLQLFFTQEVLSKYRKVFQYLIRLKRTQMELEKSWAAVMHQDHADFANRHTSQNSSISQLRRQRSRPMWRVREHMTFLIRNLQFYIQVDVIESQWNVLQGHVQNSHDFTELVVFHQEYLTALISQSFLDIGSVSRILDSIMKLCLQFCWNIEYYDNKANISELEHIDEEFHKKSNSLYTILRSSRLAGSQRAPFLRQFLMRLNFNNFFEATARGVINVIRLRPNLPALQ